VIDTLKDTIKTNQQVLDKVKSYRPMNDKWVGTLDHAIARFNSVLLRLIDHPLLLDSNRHKITRCQNAIATFYKHVRQFYEWPKWTRPFHRIMIHYTGKFKIPQIKKLLNTLDD